MSFGVNYWQSIASILTSLIKLECRRIIPCKYGHTPHSALPDLQEDCNQPEWQNWKAVYRLKTCDSQSLGVLCPVNQYGYIRAKHTLTDEAWNRWSAENKNSVVERWTLGDAEVEAFSGRTRSVYRLQQPPCEIRVMLYGSNQRIAEPEIPNRNTYNGVTQMLWWIVSKAAGTLKQGVS